MLLTIQLKKPNNRRIIFGCLGDNLANGAFFLYLAKCSRVIFIPPSWWIFSLPLRPSRFQLKTITGNHAATSPTSPLLLQVHCILQGHPLHTRGLTNVVGRWIHRKNHSVWLSSPSFLGYKQKKYSTVKEGGGKKTDWDLITSWLAFAFVSSVFYYLLSNLNYLAATVKMRGPKVMLENNFQKAKKMISYIHKINMWWMILSNSVNEGNGKRLGLNKNWRSLSIYKFKKEC